MKTLHPLLMWGSFLSFMFFMACSNDIKIPNYEKSTPSSIAGLRRVQLKENLKFDKTAIRAIVTSDLTAKNISSSSLIVQDLVSEAAVVLNLDFTNQTIKMGDIVTLNLENSTLALVNDELTVSNLTQDAIHIESSNNTVPVKSTNLASIMANAKYWGPILVKVDKINIQQGASDKLNGKLLIDDEIVEINADFLPGSIFSVESNPSFVQGLKGNIRMDKDGIILVPRNLEDIQIGLLELLEDFELGSNTNYDAKVMNFITGAWTIDGGITATSSSDPKNGKQSIRLQGTVGNNVRKGIIAMNFDLKGIKSLSVSHGIYPAAAELANVNPTVFSVEISKDGGNTYTSIGTAEIDTKSSTLKKTDFQINAGFSENTRIRIVNTSIPFSNNSRPRINIDDIHFKF